MANAFYIFMKLNIFFYIKKLESVSRIVSDFIFDFIKYKNEIIFEGAIIFK